uniref:Uncharacterized protein n=1 Tax=Manihot esculenta TaxID=3983 RepID=A0A2C9URA3_MANES
MNSKELPEEFDVELVVGEQWDCCLVHMDDERNVGLHICFSFLAYFLA